MKKMKTIMLFSKLLFYFFIIFLSFNCVIGIREQKHFNLTEKPISGNSINKILVLSIDGMITSFDRRNFFMDEKSMVSQIVGKLNKAKKDPNLKAVILKINSPGGTVTASDIIYQAILDFKKEKNVPIISLFMDTATSGAYYIATATDYIFANPTSITGSIGVIIQSVNVKKGMQKFGIENRNIVSGKNKGLNNPFSDLNAQQFSILQAIVEQMYQRFVSVVQKNRKNLSVANRNIIFDGRIFTSNQAKKLGLVDKIGYFEDSVKWIEKETGLTDLKLVVYTYNRSNFNNVYQFQSSVGEHLNLLNQVLKPKHTSQFLYLWNL